MSLKSWFRSYLLGDLEAQLQDLGKTLTTLSDQVDDLVQRVNAQDEQLKKVLSELNRKADLGLFYELSERLEDTRGDLKSLREEVDELWGKARLIEFSVSENADTSKMSIDELASITLLYIRKGLSRPSELKKAMGISWEKLYAVLSYLKMKKRVQRIQEGRAVKYVLVEEVEE